MAFDVTKTRLTAYACKWKAAGAGSYLDFGSVDEVKPDLPLKLKPIKVGTMGDVKLGDRIIGLDDKAMITIQMREISAAQLQGISPWYTSGDTPLMPASVNVDLYSYAGPLVLHPVDKGDTTEDLALLKAVPIRDYPVYDGVKDGLLNVQFLVYPDRGSFPNLVYGHVGSTP